MKLVFYDASFQGDVNDIHEKIQYLVDHFCAGNKASFSREAGIPAPVIASLTGGRKSKPSFEVLQKILAHFPVNANWLVMGQGPMLQEESQKEPQDQPNEVDAQHYVTREQYQVFQEEMRQRVDEQLALLEAYKEDLSDNIQLKRVYRIVGTPPYDNMLYERLNVTPDEARDLVLSGRIRSTYAGKDNDRARRNGVSYLVSEAAVREFLGDKPTA